MTSREKILTAVKQNQPKLLRLPNLQLFNAPSNEGLVEQFSKILEAIGAEVVRVMYEQEVVDVLQSKFDFSILKVFSPISVFADISSAISANDPHELADVDLVVLPTKFAVAENGACWITEQVGEHRVLPFITQHLSLVVKRENIVATMHQVYEELESADYGFGTFIAGPSKTADIEQSLVLGAHGARSMHIFIIG